MAEDMVESSDAPMATLQPKDTVNYRQGGDVCHVCSYYVGEGESGTCHRVDGPINGHDLCDVFQRKGSAAERSADGDGPRDIPAPAKAAAKRGLISDSAMSKMMDRRGAYD